MIRTIRQFFDLRGRIEILRKRQHEQNAEMEEIKQDIDRINREFEAHLKMLEAKAKR